MNSGVYCIENIINGKMYIGSSTNLKARRRRHFNSLREGDHHSRILQRAFNKYGESNFVFKILIPTNETLIVEQLYLDMVKPCYNVSKSATAPMTGRKHSKEALNKFKNRKVNKGSDHYFYGKKWTKKRHDDAKKRIGWKHTKETILKMSETALRVNSIGRIDHDVLKKQIQDNLGNHFTSLTAAAKFHKTSIQTVCDILKGRHIQTKMGVSFDYL